jgi:RHS repeat-associated protein
VLSITQGTQSVQMVYDLSGRVTSMTLPNGMVAGYSYDDGSRLTGISYTRNGVTIGGLTYSYDALNRRVGVSGSLAGTMLPAALTSATYDAANQVATWNGTAFTYDANGSLINDGQNTYTWDGRGRLASITGAVTAGFGYDAMGRRISKSVGPNALGFIYDNSGITQEVTGGNVTATIWSGGSNGFIARTDSSGTVFPVPDALGSILALADSNGNLLTQYFYDPFGATTSTGSASGNPFQYIGRENDLTGLYYMHARYYSPALMRFVSEDPLGFAGGDVNLHVYSINSPTNLRDPSGLYPTPDYAGSP